MTTATMPTAIDEPTLRLAIADPGATTPRLPNEQVTDWAVRAVLASLPAAQPQAEDAGGMPAIVFDGEATGTWLLAINRMSGWNATLTLASGNQLDVELVAGGRDRTGYAGLRAIPLDADGRRRAEARFWSSDDITSIHVW